MLLVIKWIGYNLDIIGDTSSDIFKVFIIYLDDAVEVVGGLFVGEFGAL
jgi:hypothetical protein